MRLAIMGRVMQMAVIIHIVSIREVQLSRLLRRLLIPLGKAVKIKVAFSNSSGKKHGFEMTALDANGNRVGTFKKIGNTTQVISPSDPARELDKADKDKYIEQSTKGVKKKSWIFNWTPPAVPPIR